MKPRHNRSFSLDPLYLRKLFQSGTRKDYVAGVRLALRHALASIDAKEHYDKVITQVKREPCYRDLNNTWEQLTPRVRVQKWHELLERLIQVAYASRPYCVRCGECCRQGSPSLHAEDAKLLQRGLITTQQVYTLRRGEPVRFNIEGRLGKLPHELIKFKERPESGHCIFYIEQQRSCRIYDHRPMQCRVQACWNPEALQKLWHKAKLTRRHLLRDDQDLAEVLKAHAERCSPDNLDAALEQMDKSGDETALEKALELLRQDLNLRATLRTKLNRNDEELEFLLGRPLTELVRAYGIRVEKTSDGDIRLIPER